MGRAPCCEKMGLKKGPWTPEEDLVLINYINTHGHANWRALPKQAGLLRCGKSCRLRWTNYLRPDIKRGNITKEEEDAIINLHQKMGNRWSAIAARLPGRTDNEIKNVWHTHLKKKLPQNQQHCPPNPKRVNVNAKKRKTKHDPKPNQETSEECSSDTSSLTTTSDNNNNNTNNDSDSPENNNLALDEEFWSEVLSSDNSDEHHHHFQLPCFSPLVTQEENLVPSSSSMGDDMDFWYHVYARTEELNQVLLEL